MQAAPSLRHALKLRALQCVLSDTDIPACEGEESLAVKSQLERACAVFDQSASFLLDYVIAIHDLVAFHTLVDPAPKRPTPLDVAMRNFFPVAAFHANVAIRQAEAHIPSDEYASLNAGRLKVRSGLGLTTCTEATT